MSASIGVYVATALFLAIGGDTEGVMKDDVWRQAGLCDRQCHWADASPECARREARNLPCEVNHPRAMFWDNYYRAGASVGSDLEALGIAFDCSAMGAKH